MVLAGLSVPYERNMNSRERYTTELLEHKGSSCPKIIKITKYGSSIKMVYFLKKILKKDVPCKFFTIVTEIAVDIFSLHVCADVIINGVSLLPIVQPPIVSLARRFATLDPL